LIFTRMQRVVSQNAELLITLHIFLWRANFICNAVDKKNKIRSSVHEFYFNSRSLGNISLFFFENWMYVSWDNVGN
jgi:hypothetical protein